MSLFADLQRSGALRVVDDSLAQTLRRLDPSTPELVLAGAALASCAIGQGHAAFDPARPVLLCNADIDWPSGEDWIAALDTSRWISAPSHDTNADPAMPLVLESGLLYLRRYREYEYHLAANLQRIATHAHAAVDVGDLAPLFSNLFPDALAGDAQARAAALALVQSLLLVTGGPGTGKTTAIARVLLLLIAQARLHDLPPPRIALAAPTGRAAERMAQGVRHVADALRLQPWIDAAWCDALPVSAQTLHRLLGTIAGNPQFRHGADNPLPFDVVIVDEASMIDLPLMCKLTDAIAPGSRLMLLGDRDQLPSIEAGDVLAAVTDAAGDTAVVPASIATMVAPLLGEIATSKSPQLMLDGHRVHLQRGHRQSASLDLAPLASAVRKGDADAAMALLRDGALAGVHWHEGLSDPLAAPLRDTLLGSWRAIAAAADPAAALSKATHLRLLTALRDGAQGSQMLNARIEEALAGARHARYFHGRLLLIGQNDYRQQLFNGDIGVCWRQDNGDMTAWFADGNGVRGFHPSALPAHDSAFAVTVHKAQGSEFDNVCVLLPRQDARTLSRELLYTAMTRARHQLHLCTSESILRATLARHVTRISGLTRRLLLPA
jgi:exodeoxyribonuclease V alpha subunit